MHQDLHSLRKSIKQKRNGLDPDYIACASLSIASFFWRSSFAYRCKKIATYNSTAGEIDCYPLEKIAWLRKKHIYSPILKKQKLNFSALKPKSKLVQNRFGILEPVYKNRDLIDPHQLDVVVVPLVAFDSDLNRIGMGGGYYDRTFAFCKRRNEWHRPLLIGVAYSFQRVTQLRPETWDVPLNAVITEQEIFTR